MIIEKDDGGLNVFRKALGGETSPLTDREKEIRRRAGIFAVATFIQPSSEDLLHTPTLKFEFEEELLRGNYDSFLTPVQMRLASEMALENFQTGTTLSSKETIESLFFGIIGGVTSGYRSFSSTFVNRIGEFLTDSTKEEPVLSPSQQAAFAGRKLISIKEHLKNDPSGLSYLRAVIGNNEEKAAQQVLETMDKVAEVEARYTVIDNFTEDEDIRPPLDAIDNGEFTDEEKEFLKGAIDELILPPLRKSYKWRAKYLILEETGLVPDEDGKPVPYNVLHVRGMHLGFERYNAAVERFLERWGK